MGLSIQVGMLAELRELDEEGAEWFREAMIKVNEVLKQKKLSSHNEPESVPTGDNRDSIGGFPYSFLHHFRRFAAHCWQNPKWKPTPFAESKDPARDPVVEGQASKLSSHLLCHSDCEGFYVPVDFRNPIFADEELIPGGMLGSSQALTRELISVAPFLGIRLVDGTLSDSEADRIIQLSEEQETPFFIELTVWLALFEAARLSIKHKTAICFG